jgi:small GTP-binding protein
MQLHEVSRCDEEKRKFERQPIKKEMNGSHGHVFNASDQRSGMGDADKVVMFGDNGVGKTSLVERFYSNKYNVDVFPTVGAAYLRVTFPVKDHPVSLNIWDTAGQEKFQSLVPLYMRNAHGLVFVLDVTNPGALLGLALMFEAVEDQVSDDMQLMLCANKIDLMDEEADLLPETEWGQQHNMELVETSAKTGQGVNEVFTRLAIKIETMGEEERRQQQTTY